MCVEGFYNRPMTSTAASPVELFDVSPGYRMAYRTWGRQDNEEAVVLIHGVTGSSLSWVRVGAGPGER